MGKIFICLSCCMCSLVVISPEIVRIAELISDQYDNNLES